MKSFNSSKRSGSWNVIQISYAKTSPILDNCNAIGIGNGGTGVILMLVRQHAYSGSDLVVFSPGALHTGMTKSISIFLYLQSIPFKLQLSNNSKSITTLLQACLLNDGAYDDCILRHSKQDPCFWTSLLFCYNIFTVLILFLASRHHCCCCWCCCCCSPPSACWERRRPQSLAGGPCWPSRAASSWAVRPRWWERLARPSGAASSTRPGSPQTGIRGQRASR